MAISQPTATDPLSSPDHSALHRIIASDVSAPVESITVDASGAIVCKSNSMTIGGGTDDDVLLIFSANSSIGQMSWMEDEDYLKIHDSIVIGDPATSLSSPPQLFIGVEDGDDDLKILLTLCHSDTAWGYVNKAVGMDFITEGSGDSEPGGLTKSARIQCVQTQDGGGIPQGLLRMSTYSSFDDSENAYVCLGYNNSEYQLYTSVNLEIASGKSLQLGNARQAGAPTPDGYLTIKDSSGTSYKIPCQAA